MVCSTPVPLYPWGKSHNPVNRRLGIPWSPSELFGEGIIYYAWNWTTISVDVHPVGWSLYRMCYPGLWHHTGLIAGIQKCSGTVRYADYGGGVMQEWLFVVHCKIARSDCYSSIYPTRCNVTQFILSGNCSTCFGWYHYPSPGAQTTVSTASGICQTVTAICRYSDR